MSRSSGSRATPSSHSTTRRPTASAEDYARHFETDYGPTLKAKQALEPDGRWQDLRAEWLELIECFLQPGGVEQEYFVISGRRGT